VGLTNSFVDRRNEELAAYLQCDASLVEAVYATSATAIVPDPEEAQETTKTTESYENALKHFERFEEALAQLPDIERAVLELQNDRWAQTIRTIKQEMLSSLSIAKRRKERAAGRGPTNHKANAIAEFVAQVFEKLNRPITFGISGHDDGPSTDFGKAVQKCLAIYDVRALPKTSIHCSQNPSQKLAPFELRENGSPAHWRRPAQAAYERRKLPNA
jgi:hypothetical protein